MKDLLVPVLLLLTLPGCSPAPSGQPAAESVSRIADSASTLTTSHTIDAAYSDNFAQQQVARNLASERYALIRQWLRREGFEDLSYDDLVAAAETSEAASTFVDCYESSTSPTGYDSRLGLLSSCLMQDANPDSQTNDTKRTASNGVLQSDAGMVTLVGDTR